MGLDISVLALDWGTLRATPVRERLGLLEDAVFPDADVGLDGDVEPRHGWVWPAAAGMPWCARYEFPGTTGSYKPHFWAGQAWEDVRDFAVPALREDLDPFLRGLFWHDDPVAPPLDGLLPPDHGPWRPGLLVACPPPTVSALAAHWARAEPLLEGLRPAYDVHAARPGRWIADFDEFAALLREWAVAVGEAERRGWGLLGLPW
ncbi:hypothetical protein [Streptomyces griseus]|uniref:hypothetical protein n=1 Tax=Streptomyces griseus TaxID=1911 RepID=UPI00055F4809|nr:hypothetical protein [Streptomyces griseus]